MSRFTEINEEYKLRVPLSAYAESIIESDCVSFSRKRNTLINLIILNFYRIADCSISLRLNDYRKELQRSIPKAELNKNENIIEAIVNNRGKELKKKYATKVKAETNKPITLSNKVVSMLTGDSESSEEKYYSKPGMYLTAMLEEYSRLSYYNREEIVFKNTINEINTAIDCNYPIIISHSSGNTFHIKPYSIASDPLSAYHYLIGIKTDKTYGSENAAFRISRIAHLEIDYYQNGVFTAKEEKSLKEEIRNNGVQFLNNEKTDIKIILTDIGLKKYRNQQHLRPTGIQDDKDPNLFHFECTEAQILFYFLSFGKDAKVIAPAELKLKFKEFYSEAVKAY